MSDYYAEYKAESAKFWRRSVRVWTGLTIFNVACILFDLTMTVLVGFPLGVLMLGLAVFHGWLAWDAWKHRPESRRRAEAFERGEWPD